jgi:dienelactone hydrolase
MRGGLPRARNASRKTLGGAVGGGLLVALLATGALMTLTPYWRATAMILRAAGTTGLSGRAARWDGRTVVDHLDEISTPEGRIRIRTFRPSGGATHATLVVSGVHPDGIDEPRLIDLARDLAATGVNVVTPDIPDLRTYRLTARVTDTIEHAALWLTTRDELSGGRRVGMIGVSFSGGLSVVAAGRERLRDRVAYVLSFGGHGNLPRVLRYFCTGAEPSPGGGIPGTQRQPHDYALAVLLYQAADLVVPADQVDLLRRGIETFLKASALARQDQERALDVFRLGQLFQEQLPEPSATLFKYVNDRNVGALGAYLLPFLDQLGQDPALSPDRSAPPSAPVYLLHGNDDNVIPAIESELLAVHLQRHTRVRMLVSGFLTHVDVSNRPTLEETWRMISFWKAALGER